MQRGRSGSAVGITPAGGPGAAAAGAGAVGGVAGVGAGAGAVAAAAVAAGSPARSGQQQFVGIGGGGGGGVGGVGVAAAGVSGLGSGAGVGSGLGIGPGSIRQRSASTVLDINLPQRKISVGGGPSSPVILQQRSNSTAINGFGTDASLIPSRHEGFNGQVGQVGSGSGSSVIAPGVGLTATHKSVRGRLSIGGAAAPLIASSASPSTGSAGALSGNPTGNTLGDPASAGGNTGSAPTIGGTPPVQAPGPKRQGSFSNVFSKLIDGMPAGTMFAKFKSTNVAASSSPQNVADGNPITQYFEIGKPVACAGPELIWRIHDAYRKSDNKVSAW